MANSLDGRTAVMRKRVARPYADVCALAATLDRLPTDHVIRIREVVPDGSGGVVVVTDRAEGGNLANVLRRRGRLAGPEIVTLVAPLAGALAAAHAAGLTHGRVSATNIVFDAGGRPLWTDLGVAPGSAPGSASDDVFALATLALHALAGNAPSALVDALAAAAHADPDQRLSAADLAAAVLASTPAAPLGVHARPEPLTTAAPRHRRPQRRHRQTRRITAALAAVIAVAAIVSAAARLGGHHHDAPTATAATEWSRLLATLDDARTRAFATLHDADLLDVYSPTSPLLARDRATVGELRARGLHVRGRLPALVIAGTPSSVPAADDLVTLAATQTVGTYEIVDARGRVISRGEGSPIAGRFDLTLVRIGQRWLVASVTPVIRYGGGPSR